MEIITERSRRGIDAYAEPALVSAGPWQGLDAMASAERVPIRVSGAEPAAAVQGAQHPVEGKGALQRRGGPLFDKS